MISRSPNRHGFTATLLLLAALPAYPAAVLAQAVQGPQEPAAVPPSEMEGIGPPQLRRYQLPGERIIPSQPQAAPAPAIPSRAPPEPSAAQPPAATPVRTPERPQPTRTSPTAERTTVPEQSPAAAGGQVDAPVVDPAAAMPLPVPGATEFVPPPPAPAYEEPTDTDLTRYWPYLVAALIGSALIVLLLRMSRRPDEEDRVEFQIVEDWAPAPIPESAPAPLPVQAKAPAPVPPQARAPDAPAFTPPVQPQAPPPVAADAPSYLLRPSSAAAKPAQPPATAVPVDEGVVGVQIRPWLQLQFKPDRAAATLTEATVQYELTIANTGNAVARNVLVEARMFNADAAQEQEIKDFFAAPVHANGNGRILAIPARNVANLRSVVTMPNEDVREIEINGRRLFIPTVAINVSYEWGSGKTGRTSASYIVGREPEKPATKMGPFRLDLGPRIYRQIGQRPSQPAVLV